jgi:hypothetical protein
MGFERRHRTAPFGLQDHGRATARSLRRIGRPGRGLRVRMAIEAGHPEAAAVGVVAAPRECLAARPIIIRRVRIFHHRARRVASLEEKRGAVPRLLLEWARTCEGK